MWKTKTVLVLILIAAICPISHAGLLGLGPIDDNNGFPLFIVDQDGVAVQIGLDGLSIFDPVDPTNPFSVQIGFGDEAFYWTTDARMDFANGDDARLVLAVEAAFFGDGTPQPGQQLVFTRIRIRFEPPVSGTYTVIHPYGTQVFENLPAGDRLVWTGDFGGFAPYDRVLDGPIPVLLTAVNPAPPVGYLGNPQITQTVTGSPTGNNFFRIEGPAGSNLGGAGVNFVETNLFSVSGKLYELGTEDSYCTGLIAGDLTGDCKVNLADLAVFASNWLTCNLEPQSACE